MDVEKNDQCSLNAVEVNEVASESALETTTVKTGSPSVSSGTSGSNFAKYTISGAVICFLIALATLLADQQVIDFFEKYVDFLRPVLAILLLVVGLILMRWQGQRKGKYPDERIINRLIGFSSILAFSLAAVLLVASFTKWLVDFTGLIWALFLLILGVILARWRIIRKAKLPDDYTFNELIGFGAAASLVASAIIFISSFWELFLNFSKLGWGLLFFGIGLVLVRWEIKRENQFPESYLINEFIKLATALAFLISAILLVNYCFENWSDQVDLIFAAGLLILTVLLLRWVLKRNQVLPGDDYSTEGLNLLLALSLGGALTLFGAHFQSIFDHPFGWVLIAAISYFCLSNFTKSQVLMGFALAALGNLLVALFYWEDYYLPRMVFLVSLLGLGLLISAFWFGVKRSVKLAFASRISLLFGLSYTFIALWNLSLRSTWVNSIYGNNGMFLWMLIAFCFSAVTLIYGMKIKNGLIRNFGVVFALTLGYTKYFEFCWEWLHHSLFFALLALSLLLMGLKADKIWLRRQQQRVEQDKPIE